MDSLFQASDDQVMAFFSLREPFLVVSISLLLVSLFAVRCSLLILGRVLAIGVEGPPIASTFSHQVWKAKSEIQSGAKPVCELLTEKVMLNMEVDVYCIV
jgi:hypothetical protein